MGKLNRPKKYCECIDHCGTEIPLHCHFAPGHQFKGKNRGENNPMFGKKRPGKLSGMFGKTQSDHQKSTVRDLMTGRDANLTIDKQRESLFKYYESLTEEDWQKIKDSHKGQVAWNRGLTKETDERVAKFSVKIKGRKNEWLIGVPKPDVSIRNKKRWQDPEFKKQQSELIKLIRGSSENRKKSSEIFKLMWKDPEKRKKQSEYLKKKWCDPEWREKQLLAIGKGSFKFPNNPEFLLHFIVRELYTGWKYTGDLSVMINGKNPDFVNEERKLIIEHYGDYWHKGDDPVDREEIFAQAGYETLVIWEHELAENLDNVLYKIKLLHEFSMERNICAI